MVTPIQVVRMMATVANGGKLVTPHIVRHNIKSDEKTSNNEDAEDENITLPETQLKISKQTLSLIRQGLYQVVNSEGGTAHNTGLEKFSVAGKTSTAEVSAPGIERRSHAWFVGFAPFDKPRFAFVIMLEHGGKGSENAAPIAAGFMDTALQVEPHE
jgi:penicillin-binding protein 2